MSGVFRKIETSEIQEGYNIIVARTNWLNQQGIPQWTQPIPFEVISQRQAAGRFFGYWANGGLTAVVCLLDKSVLDWGDQMLGNYLCMATLASAVQYKGKGYGEECAIEACNYSKTNGCERVYLDCVDNDGALPRFYSKLGFEILNTTSYAGGFKIVLMVKNLTDSNTAFGVD